MELQNIEHPFEHGSVKHCETTNQWGCFKEEGYQQGFSMSSFIMKLEGSFLQGDELILGASQTSPRTPVGSTVGQPAQETKSRQNEKP